MRKTGRNGVLKAIAVWLLIGAAANIGVAWGIALWEASRWGTVVDDTMTAKARGYIGAWPSSPPAYWSDTAAVSVWDVERPWARCRQFIADRSVETTSSNPPLSAEYRLMRLDVGLPLRSMSWESLEEHERRPMSGVVRTAGWQGLRGGLPLSDTPSVFGTGIRRLPLWPAPLEFIANAFFWGAAIWLLTGGLRRWRRHWRAERGQCLHCAYDRVGLTPQTPCPECGRAPA